LLDSIRGELDNLGMPALGGRIDGVVRSENGFVAWGVVELSRDAGRFGRLPSLTEQPLVDISAAGVTVEARYRHVP
jgi:hypothetical protein